jgi:hypothetical protein
VTVYQQAKAPAASVQLPLLPPCRVFSTKNRDGSFNSADVSIRLQDVGMQLGCVRSQTQNARFFLTTDAGRLLFVAVEGPMPFLLLLLVSFGSFLATVQDPENPIADQPQTEQNPFADQRRTGQDPVKGDSPWQQTPKLPSPVVAVEPETSLEGQELATQAQSTVAPANSDQSATTGVPAVQSRRKLFPGLSFDIGFDPLYLLLLLLLIPFVWGWLRARSRKNRLLKIQKYAQQFSEVFPPNPNIHRQPVHQPPFRRRSAPQQPGQQQPVANGSGKPARFRDEEPTPEEIELSLHESGEELHLGQLSASDESESEAFDFSAESGLDLEIETSPETAGIDKPIGDVAETGKQVGPAAKPVGPAAKRRAASTVANPARRRRFSEPESDRMFAADKEAIMESELDGLHDSADIHDSEPDPMQSLGDVAAAKLSKPEHARQPLDDLLALANKLENKISRLDQALLFFEQREPELDAAKAQVAKLDDQLRLANENWAQRLEERQLVIRDLENRANTAESRLADFADKSAAEDHPDVAELQASLAAIQADCNAAEAQKRSLATQVTELEAMIKLVESDAKSRMEELRTALTRAEEQATHRVVDAEQQAAARLEMVRHDYEARLADAESRNADSVATARQEAADALAMARTEAAKKIAEVESQAAARILESEKQHASQLADAQVKATAMLAEAESRAAETLAQAERNAAARLADEKSKAATELAKVQSSAAAKIAKVEAKLADQLARSTAPSELAKLKGDAAAKLATAEQAAAEQLAAVQAQANARIAELETEAAAKLATTEQAAAEKLATVQAQADARIAELQTEAAAKLATTEQAAAEKLAAVQAQADARIAELQTEAAAKLATTEQAAAEKLAAVQAQADARIALVESQADEKIAQTNETAEAKIANAFANADARVAEVEAQTREKIAAAEAAATQSETTAQASVKQVKTDLPDDLTPAAVARIIHKYKKERAQRIESQKMLDEAEVHRAKLARQIKDLQKQVSSQLPAAD